MVAPGLRLAEIPAGDKFACRHHHFGVDINARDSQSAAGELFSKQARTHACIQHGSVFSPFQAKGNDARHFEAPHPLRVAQTGNIP